MSNNTDKIETNQDLIDTTPAQAESLTGKRKVAVHTVNVMANPKHLEEFGEHIVANTCKEILTALHHGISREDLISSLEHAIHCNLESSGVVKHDS